MSKKTLATEQIRSAVAFVPDKTTKMRWSDAEAERFDEWLAEHDRELTRVVTARLKYPGVVDGIRWVR